MSRFNANTKVKSAARVTTNIAGGKAYALDGKTAFATLLLTALFSKDGYYTSNSEKMNEVLNTIQNIDPKFAAKAAVYTRDRHGLRSVSHIVGAVIPNMVKDEEWVRPFIKNVVVRPDDITEILSAHEMLYGSLRKGTSLPNSLRRGLADAFQKFDGYQLSKYKAGKKNISLIDAVNITHPKHNEFLGQLMTGQLNSADTWEVGLSEAGPDADAKADVWNRLIRERKLGYFALLRNLRNIQKNAPDVLDLALEQLVDPVKIKKSRVLPFRFVTAYNILEREGAGSQILTAISKALELSLNNVPDIGGKNAVIIDVSGSMDSQVAGSKDPISCRQLADIFGAVIAKRSNADIYMFGSQCQIVPVVNLTDSVMSIAKNLDSKNRGGYGSKCWPRN
jgi:60 kDa SS-A/Ro ribonucleoprotein